MKTKRQSVGADESTDRRETGAKKASQPAQPMSERTRMANRDWYPGLCTTCVNEPVCTFPRSVDYPVTSCDEFEGGVEVKPLRSLEGSRLTERFAVANREWFPGLCMTCEKRETCTFPKPEGGVFNCDEFE